MRRPLALILAVLGLAGCGDATGSEDEPGSIVPASAYIYAEANLDPEGDQQDAIATVLAALPGVGAPSKRLQEQFNAYAIRRYGRRAANFEEDIEPWLGKRLAAFGILPATGRDLDDVRTGLIAATKDRAKAEHWLFTVSRGRDERERRYKGVRYLYSSGDEPLAHGLVDGFVVAADEAAFKAVVDTRRRKPLADQPRFAKAARSDDDRLGVLWYDVRRLVDTLAARSGQRYLEEARPLLRRMVPDQPLVLTARAEKKAIVLDTAIPAARTGLLGSFFNEGSALMDQLPQDAVAVIGQPDFGVYLRRMMALSNAGHGGYAGFRRDLRAPGFDVERDLIGWMTDAALFLRANRDGTLGGALVVQGGDADSVYWGTLRFGRYLFRRGVDVRDVRIPGSSVSFKVRLPGLRDSLYVAEAGKRMVVSYGADSARAAISIGGLGGEERFEAARGRLGLDWGAAAYVDVQRLLAVLGRGGGDLGGARPFVEAIRYAIVGGRSDGKRLRSHTEIVVR